MTSRNLRTAFLASAALAILPGAALAQDAETDEIIITAQQRAEPLRNVPIQVTAFTAQAVEDAGIKSTSDIIAQVPNITYDRGDTYRSNFITMRGLTQINNADPPIAFVLDGVPQTNQKQLGVTLFDIERIEVLKGPQGALYGRNAVGGAINVVTKAPGNELEGFVNLGYANGDTIDASAGISGALVEDKVLVRVSGSYTSSDGLIKNDFRGDRVDYIDHDYSLRGRMILKPTDLLTFDLRAEYSDFRGGSNSYAAVFSGIPRDFVNPQFNFPAYAEGDSVDLTGKFDYDFGFATLTGISAWSKFQQNNRADLDFRNPVDSPGGIFGLGFQAGQGQNAKLETFSQELRLVSASDQAFRWLVGLYYLNTDRALVTRGFIDIDGSDQFDNTALLIANNNETNDNNAYAAFAQVDYDLTPTLTLTGGIRYDEDKREQTNVVTGAVRKTSFDRVQPKVTLTWKPEDGRLVYATYSTGFRSGGFNAPNVTVPVFDAETLDNFEVGFKTQWFDRKLTLNGAAYLTNVKNYQYFYVDAATASQIIDTIDKVQIKGFEIEAMAKVAPGLDASFGVGTTDSEIKRSLFPSDVGNHSPRTVPLSINSSIQYRGELSETVAGFVRIEHQHIGKKYWDADNASVQNPYDLLNARMGVEFGNYGLYAFARNIFNEKYYSEFFQPKYSGLDVAIGYRGTPRTYGVEAKVKF
ncbi:TonB-dependent receptor [Sphingosinicella sp.]|uniref:TonB-dependent receptor n=1 Tax=Sphingosinicella sp. TaxID=1917971 RepID=UPI0025FB9AF7|nr:TonB-dependent receptor [Sphingosinicella sp.]